ncbi:pyroglutamyl-peptidase I [Oerskovia paurometabola]|uniref:Pyroglutamyl-peptidase I n=1 Tax=Oerskovia paurometabola TaxID=162170 RepID=A0ABW1XE87_9CELL|nr:pyroglutamyl-peptidase I [Oerskovia paurometabola]MBM7497303.1 pyroglutamyl-peptidase [Oerskovia paurometabola]
MTVLLSGFEPFDGAATNASWQAVSALRDAWDADEPLVAVELPCTFAGAWPALLAAIQEYRPRVVVAVGLAGGADVVRLERVAINVVDARIPDNEGSAPVDVPVVEGGPAAYFTTLPLKPSLVAVREAGVPVAVSGTAGTYVCNATFYDLVRWADGRDEVRAGFVHVPAVSEPGRPVPDVGSLPLAAVVRALRVVVETALADLDGRLAPDAARVVSAGAEH